MSQLSLFSADLVEPRQSDLGGLLAAHGQVVRSGNGARLSILLSDGWRAEALLRECLVRDVAAEVLAVNGDWEAPITGGVRRPAANGWPVLLRTEHLPGLLELATDWTRGAVKAVPRSLQVQAGLLRCWTLAAGIGDDAGFLLGLDPRAPDTHEPLAAACSRGGVAGALTGVRVGRPAVRIVGRRRISRLAEMLGTPPLEAPPGAFPMPRP